MEEVLRYERAIEQQLASKLRRLEHSRGVAHAAQELARAHGVDERDAYIAGLLHDWGKAYSSAEVCERARELGVDMGVDLELVAPLLHGPVAARELREAFPELGEHVLRAIERHTIGAADMGPLDMAVFVADAIEPSRPAHPSIVRLREAARSMPLDDLYWMALRDSITFVIETERYLYPGTLEIYNQLALARADKETA